MNCELTVKLCSKFANIFGLYDTVGHTCGAGDQAAVFRLGHRRSRVAVAEEVVGFSLTTPEAVHRHSTVL